MKQMKRLAALFLALALLLTALPLNALAAETAELPEETGIDTVSEESPAAASSSGKCGANLTWTLSSDGSKLTISGTGAMYDYDGMYPPWGTFYNNGIETVIIGNSVTSIGAGAFNCFFDLTSVTIGSSVKSIGNYSFVGCIRLESIAIPRSVTYIADEAFDDCISTFYGYRGTVAETYAKTHGITFIPLDVAYPTMSSITNVSNGVKITWSAVSGATKYDIYRKASGDSSWTKVGTSTTTSYTSTGVTSGKTYTFTVQAVTGSGSSSYGSSTKTIRYLSMPSLTVSNVVGGIKLSWTKSTGASSGYYVYRKTESGSYSRIACVATGTLTYTDTTASAGVKYYYAVRAASNGYLSAYSAKSITRLSTPSGITVTNTAKGVRVTWGAVKGATSYEVYRKPVGGSWTKVGTSTTTSYTSTGVESGKTYTFTVRAVYNTTRSAYNTTGKTIRFLSEPTLTVQNMPSGAKLTWTKSTGASGGYYVYRKTEGGSYKKIASVATGTLTYTDTTAVSGTTYYYAVRAYSNGYLSSYTGKTIVRLGHPTLTLTRDSTGVKLTWTKSSNCTGYYIYRKSGTGSYTKIKTVTGSGTLTWTDTTAKKGVTYTYAVRAYKGSSQSSYTGKSISY